MQRRGRGALLVTSATAAVRGNAGQISHSAAMAGRRAVCQSLNAEFAASGVDIEEDIQHEPVQVLDRLEVQEYAPVAYTVRMSCEIFRTVFSVGNNVPSTAVSAPGASAQYGSLKGLDLFPKVGSNPMNALLKAEMVATITDKATNKTIATVLGVKAESKQFNIRARQIVGENVRFNAIRVIDESEGTA